MSRGQLVLAARWARRELRGGLGGFRIFLACLILGVGAIAAVGSLSSAFLTGIQQQSRALLGGDVAVTLTQRPLTAPERTFISKWGRLSEIAEMQAMARAPAGKRTIIELKSVDGAYPLFGQVTLKPAQPLAKALGRDKNGHWGVLVDPLLLDRLQIGVGDSIDIGAQELVVRGRLVKDPDAATGLYTLGPRVLISQAALAKTGLVTLGSLVRYSYRLALTDPSDAGIDRFTAAANKAFPDAGWRITDRRSAAPRLKALTRRIAVFLTFVGLTALVVGGVGVGNAVTAFLSSRTETIATLKCIGARPGLIFATYLFEVLALAALAILIGLALGAATPFLLRGVLSDLLPVDLAPRLYPAALGEAALYGTLTALVFTLAPLARARDLPPAALFRSPVAAAPAKLGAPVRIAILLLLLVLAITAVVMTSFHVFAAVFVVGAAATYAFLRGLGAGLTRLARRLPRPHGIVWRLALANLHRPGAPTGVIVLSLGLGLTLLGGLALLGGNVHAQIADALPRQAPDLWFIDIQKSQAAAFDKLVKGVPGVTELNRVANIRGRITRVAGKPASQIKPAPGAAWVLKGDQGLTYSPTLPKGSKLVAGKWWPADYSGPPLVSVYAGAARGLGLKVGDTLTINVLGREIKATVASLRDLDFSVPGFNYVIVYSPGVLEAAPFDFVANARMSRAAEDVVYQKVTDTFPNVSVVRSRDAIQSILRIVEQLELGVRLTSLLALAAGALVLAGALAAGYRARAYDAVILKVLGARRRQIVRAYLFEFALLGSVVGLFAALLSSLIAWLILHFALKESWIFLPGTLAATLVGAVLVTAGLGLVGTWRTLSVRPAAALRDVG